ncbi:MAG: RHS repeat-associated core domain-containing protein [Deltaproteobacteria bacterium]|nr:RHS repeat-associated core domain-containing protein [Deltaproteobacteria bacterium]
MGGILDKCRLSAGIVVVFFGLVQVEASVITSAQTEKFFYLTDHLGSTRVVTDGSGSEQARYAYYPFGQIRGSDLSQHATFNTYTNQKFDAEINLYYYGARYYDAQLARFISPDPAGDGLNLYAYVANNPLRYIDPTGEKIYFNFAAAPDGSGTQQPFDEWVGRSFTEDQRAAFSLKNGEVVLDEERVAAIADTQKGSGTIFGSFVELVRSEKRLSITIADSDTPLNLRIDKGRVAHSLNELRRIRAEERKAEWQKKREGQGPIRRFFGGVFGRPVPVEENALGITLFYGSHPDSPTLAEIYIDRQKIQSIYPGFVVTESFGTDARFLELSDRLNTVWHEIGHAYLGLTGQPYGEEAPEFKKYSVDFFAQAAKNNGIPDKVIRYQITGKY